MLSIDNITTAIRFVKSHTHSGSNATHSNSKLKSVDAIYVELNLSSSL